MIIIFFDIIGQFLFEKNVEIAPRRRYTLTLSELIDASHGPLGTFSVFHISTLDSAIGLGSYLSGRG